MNLAKEHGFVFADMHPLMMEVMAKAKAANGEAYHVCGSDGVHPEANGHLVMAYTFLKALGVDGEIGTISVDMNAGATATDGHKIISAKEGQVAVESSRYPFCFFGGEKDPNGTRSILPFLPFNEDLNRYLLVVKNLAGENADVTWGNVTNFRSMREALNGDAELDGLLEQLYGKLAAKQEKLQTEARAMVQPVKHQLTIKAN